MAHEVLNCCGLKCPVPAMQVTVLANKLKPGDTIEVTGDCPTFEKDIRDWSTRTRRTLLWVKDEGNMAKRIQIKI